MNKSKFNLLLYIVFLISFVWFISTLNLRPYPFSYIAKIIPIIAILGLAYNNISGKKKSLITTALIFSAIGDIILDLNGKGFFIFGLTSFAIAHCFYIAAFFTKPQLLKIQLAFGALFIFYGITAAIILIPYLDKMFIPVIIYLITITSMAVSVSLGKNNYLAILGAFLFVLSDSVIAFNMFYIKIPHSSFWILSSYYPAQLLLTYGSYKK